MVYRPKIEESLCFVLMPFHDRFPEYFNGIIKPAANAAGLEARKADDIYGTGSIIRDIWEQIWAAKVVVADVTGKNPMSIMNLESVTHSVFLQCLSPSG
jgi:hypothetical protein